MKVRLLLSLPSLAAVRAASCQPAPAPGTLSWGAQCLIQAQQRAIGRCSMRGHQGIPTPAAAPAALVFQTAMRLLKLLAALALASIPLSLAARQLAEAPRVVVPAGARALRGGGAGRRAATCS